MSGSFCLFVLITRCLLGAYLLCKAIIFDSRPPELPEPATRARAHLPPPLAIYLHLAGERIDLLRANGVGLDRGAGLLPAAPPGGASNVSAARPTRGTATASNIEQQRHLASTCSNAVRPGKCQQSRPVPALARRWEVRGRSFQMGARARGPRKGVPTGPLTFCFPNSPNNLLKDFALFSSFTLPCRIKRRCAKDLPRSPPYSGAFLGSEHLSSRRCTLRGSRDLLPAARAQNCSILLPCRWFRTAYSAAARRTLGWDADFSLLPTVCPLVCSPTRTPPPHARSLSTSPSQPVRFCSPWAIDKTFL